MRPYRLGAGRRPAPCPRRNGILPPEWRTTPEGAPALAGVVLLYGLITRGLGDVLPTLKP